MNVHTDQRVRMPLALLVRVHTCSSKDLRNPANPDRKSLCAKGTRWRRRPRGRQRVRQFKHFRVLESRGSNQTHVQNNWHHELLFKVDMCLGVRQLLPRKRVWGEDEYIFNLQMSQIKKEPLTKIMWRQEWGTWS